MNVLIVLAHPERRSFCGALQTTAVEVFHEQGHQVTTSDLYAMGWKAVLDRDDFADYPTDQPFNVQQAQRVAVATASQSPDIAEEQAKLASADLLILIFPVWWFAVPAILKGWIDRVFALDVVYGGGRWFDHGVYRGKRALIACTTGGRQDRFTGQGLFGPIEWLLHPLRVGTLNFCGFDTLEPFFGWSVAHANLEERRRLLTNWRTRLRHIETEAPQPFRYFANFPSPAMRDHQ